MSAIAIEVYLVLAVYGWGVLFAALLARRGYVGTEGGALGLAGLTLIGGGLVMAGAVSPTVVIALAAVGAVAGAVQLGRAALAWRREGLEAAQGAQGSQGTPWGPGAYAALAVLAWLLVRGLTVAAALRFNQHDDFQGYLIYPHRLLAEGRLIDPFDGRRLISGLQAKAFIDAVGLAHLDVSRMYFTERVLGSTLLFAAALAWLREQLKPVANDVRVASAMLWLVLAFGALGVVEGKFQDNTSATCTASVLLFGLITLLDRVLRGGVGAASWGLYGAAGLVAGAACSFKSNLIPGVAALLPLAAGVSLAGAPRGLRGPLVWRWCVAAVVALAVVLPWMIELRQSSGTYLYPVLGLGYFSLPAHISTPWTFISTPDEALRTVRHLVLPAGLGLATLLWAVSRGGAGRKAGAAMPWILLVAMLAQTLAIGINTGGEAMVRYSFAFFTAAAVYMLLRLLVDASWAGRLYEHTPKGALPFAAAVLVTVGLGNVMHPRGMLAWTPPDQSPAALHALSASERQRYAGLTRSIPPGVPVLAYVDNGFQLPFARNKIYTPYLACVSFPPPGFSCTRGPGELVKYLRGIGIRYVVFSYRYRANTFVYLNDGMTDAGRFPPTIVAFARYPLIMADLLEYVTNNSRALYDDGRDKVVDLDTFVDRGTFVFHDYHPRP